MKLGSWEGVDEAALAPSVLAVVVQKGKSANQKRKNLKKINLEQWLSAAGHSFEQMGRCRRGRDVAIM